MPFTIQHHPTVVHSSEDLFYAGPCDVHENCLLTPIAASSQSNLNNLTMKSNYLWLLTPKQTIFMEKFASINLGRGALCTLPYYFGNWRS